MPSIDRTAYPRFRGLDGLEQSRTLYRYRQAIRTHLGSRPFSHGGREVVIRTVHRAAQVMSDPADLDPRPLFGGIPHTKNRQFAAEAKALETGDLRDVCQPGRRHTLLLCLLHQTQTETRDQLVEMFIRRMRRTRNRAVERLHTLQKNQRTIEEELLAVFGQVLRHAGAADADEELGRNVRQVLREQGGVETLDAQYHAVTAYHNDNYLPLTPSSTGRTPHRSTTTSTRSSPRPSTGRSSRRTGKMMQVVLSIQAGKVLPSMLLRKLGSRSRKNRLFLAFRELGRVVRALCLLRFVSEAELRQSIRAETIKIESYNDFLDWIGFGGPVIKSGDPVEQLEQVKYMELVANAVMMQNVVDLKDVLAGMAAEGLPVTRELVARTAPTIRDHLRRFGKYDIDMEVLPPPLRPRPLPILDDGP